MQAIRATRAGGHVGYVGVSHDVVARRARAVLLRRAPARRPRPGAPVPARADPADLGPQDRPRQGLRPHPPARGGGRGLQGDGRAPRHQGAPHRLTRSRAAGATPLRPPLKQESPVNIEPAAPDREEPARTVRRRTPQPPPCGKSTSPTTTPAATMPQRRSESRPRSSRAITHLAFYAGWPRAMSAITTARNVFTPADAQRANTR